MSLNIRFLCMIVILFEAIVVRGEVAELEAKTCDERCECNDESVSQYLSISSDFPIRSSVKRVLGFHVGCVCVGEDGETVEFKFYKDGMRTEEPVVWSAERSSTSLKTFEKEARERLSIEYDPGRYGKAHLRQGFRVFEPFTRKPISSIEEMIVSRGTNIVGHESVRSGVVYLIEGGQFVFPGVKVGTKQEVILRDSSLVPSSIDGT